MLQLKRGESTIQTQDYLADIKRTVLIPLYISVFENIAQETLEYSIR